MPDHRLQRTMVRAATRLANRFRDHEFVYSFRFFRKAMGMANDPGRNRQN
jgi:hypothetical protein